MGYLVSATATLQDFIELYYIEYTFMLPRRYYMYHHDHTIPGQPQVVKFIKIIKPCTHVQWAGRLNFTFKRFNSYFDYYRIG